MSETKDIAYQVMKTKCSRGPCPTVGGKTAIKCRECPEYLEFLNKEIKEIRVKRNVVKGKNDMYENPIIEILAFGGITLFPPMQFRSIDDCVNAEAEGKTVEEWYGEEANQKYLKECWGNLTVEDLDELFFDSEELRQELKETMLKCQDT